jgi:ribosomal protein S12 methylthiotransferase accessory factor
VERDSYAIWWYTRSQRTEVDLDQFDDPYIRDLRVQLAETGRRLWVLDITSDLGIPSYVALTHWVVDSQDRIEFGSGAHFDPQIALLRAMTELSQFLSIGLMGGRSPEGLDYHGSDSPPAFRLKDHPYLTPAGGSTKLSYASSKFNELDKRDQVMACVDLARKHGLDFLVLDQTRPDIEVPVVRVIVPGLRHFYPRFAPGRLYDVPVMLGLRDGPLSEEQLNPFHPRT